jgi:hypothetical protein
LERWGGEFRNNVVLSTPVTTGGQEFTKWFKRAHFDPNNLNLTDPKDPNYYAYRHIATTYNIDRIIDPNGSKMVNVNRIYDSYDLERLSSALWRGLYDAGLDDNALAAQIAVNIKDYVDSDSEVTYYGGCYGFEGPCIYISELAYRFVPSSGQDDPDHHSYAAELYRPVPDDGNAIDWQLVVNGNSITIDWPIGEQFYVIRNEDPCAPLDVSPGVKVMDDVDILVFKFADGIELQRDAENGDDIIVDSTQVPDWLVSEEGIKSYKRDITRHKCIRRLWDRNGTDPNNLTLGDKNSYVDDMRKELVQARPKNSTFTSIGEIGIIFCKPAYYRPQSGEDPILLGVIGYSSNVDTEDEVRVNLADPKFRQIFKYLTVFDPVEYGNSPDEKRVKGRININTAPWFVIAQLPWITNPNLPLNDPGRYNLAKAIVAYRDTMGSAFENIGELMLVRAMDYYANDPNDLMTYPDLTPGDNAGKDFEERDVIFSRISNIVTVRSDVFSAYILVRIGVDGPQKRVLAILDRSQVTASGGKVKILALHPVPDPR